MAMALAKVLQLLHLLDFILLFIMTTELLGPWIPGSFLG
jgi:hypothetical protein